LKYRQTLFLAAILLLASQIVAFGKTYPWTWLPYELGRVLWFGASLAFLAFVVHQSFFVEKKFSGLNLSASRAEEGILAILGSRTGLAVLVGLNVIFQILNFVKFKTLGYHFPFFCIIACFAAIPWMKKGRVLTAFALNIALLIGAIIHFPLTSFRSDMLNVIRQGLDSWGQGKDPYYIGQYPWGLSGMPYFPGILFSHLPAWALGIDFRWDQVFYRAAWMALLYRQASFARNQRAATLMIFFALNPFINFRHDLYFEIFLLLLALWAVFGKARFIIIPLIAVTWQFAWALCPFLMWEEIFHTGEQTVRHRLGRMAKLGGGFVIVIGSILLLLKGTTTLSSFLKCAFFVIKAGASHGIFVIDYGLTLAPAFIWSGLEKYASVVELLGGVAIFVYYVIHRKGKPNVFWLCTSSALVFFIMTSIHFWQYFWVFPVFWMILGLLDGKESAPA
jgi:hypothetical protein